MRKLRSESWLNAFTCNYKTTEIVDARAKSQILIFWFNPMLFLPLLFFKLALAILHQEREIIIEFWLYLALIFFLGYCQIIIVMTTKMMVHYICIDIRNFNCMRSQLSIIHAISFQRKTWQGRDTAWFYKMFEEDDFLYCLLEGMGREWPQEWTPQSTRTSDAEKPFFVKGY